MSDENIDNHLRIYCNEFGIHDQGDQAEHIRYLSSLFAAWIREVAAK